MSQLFHDVGPQTEGRRVMLATTAYDSPDASYTFAMAKSREALHLAGIPTEYVLLQGNCHVDDARNVVCQEFLLSKCDDLIFIDADVSWQPADLIKLCGYDAEIVGGIYPFRRDDQKSRGNMPVRMIEGVYEPDETGLLEVEGLPAGFMRISRHVIEGMARSVDQFRNRNDTRSLVPILFERIFENGNRWGGDLNFCRKWRARGGKVHAAYEMRLGHTAKMIVRDSLGAALRRQAGKTLQHVAHEVSQGRATVDLMSEARRCVGNEAWGALEDVLMLCAVLPADGPIIEAGSGLSTIVLAAAHPDQTVFCLEHDAYWADRVTAMAHEAGVRNIAICRQPIRHGWYDLSDIKNELPEHFALGLNDGPPRTIGSRMKFFTRFGDTDTVIADDADDQGYATELKAWCGRHGRTFDLVEERGALIRKERDAQGLPSAQRECGGKDVFGRARADAERLVRKCQPSAPPTRGGPAEAARSAAQDA